MIWTNLRIEALMISFSYLPAFDIFDLPFIEEPDIRWM